MLISRISGCKGNTFNLVSKKFSVFFLYFYQNLSLNTLFLLTKSILSFFYRSFLLGFPFQWINSL